MVFVAAFILQNQAVAKICVYAAGVVILCVFAPDPQQQAQRTRRPIAALVLTVQTIFFFIFYSQMAPR